MQEQKNSNDVFNRFEQKYIIDQHTAAALLEFLVNDKHMQYDKHCADGQPYPIHNLYYDTADRALIRRSLDKPTYKQKLRLRSYANFDDPSKIVWIEVKKKYQGQVNKRRSKMVLSEAKQFIASGNMSTLSVYSNAQVIRELQYFVNSDNFYPTVKITYQRLALISKQENYPDLRITFDSNLLALQKMYDPNPIRLLPADQSILEVKAQHALPLWLTSYLTEHQIRRSSFSKYGKFHLLNCAGQAELKEAA